MCYHKRNAYSCGHNGWGPEVNKCHLQMAYLDGTYSKECETMNAHPLHSRKIQAICQACFVNQKKTSSALSTVKAGLSEMKEKMARAQKGRGSSEHGTAKGEHPASAGIDDDEFEPIMVEMETW